MPASNHAVIVDRHALITASTASAVHVLMAGGLPKEQALGKVGLASALIKQVNKIAEKYIAYYADGGEELYTEKLERNHEKGRNYIESCVNLYIACEQAEIEFASVITESIVEGAKESPELALKVAERRFPEYWAPKKESNINVKTDTTIKTIEIVLPTIEPCDAEDAEFSEV